MAIAMAAPPRTFRNLLDTLLIMKAGLAALAILLAGCSPRAPMQLWYWHHSYLVSEEALERSKALVDRAAAAGYTGVALWDSNLVFLNRPEYLRRFAEYAHRQGLVVMPAILPYGHSDDVLKMHPEWAEGTRVIETGSSKEPAVALGRGRFGVRPWTQYRLRFSGASGGAVGAIDAGDRKSVRLDDTIRPGASDFVFNSAASTQVRVFGPGPFTLQETALVNVVGAVEKHGELMDYEAIVPVYGEGLGMCLTNPEVQRWAAGNAHAVENLFPADSPLFLQYDEMRHMNSCARCRGMRMTAGELLAWNLEKTIASLPPRQLYVWSDMFDPWHNARDHFYFVEGDLKGSWEGLPRDAVVMNWNAAHRRASLEWFASRGNRQVIAGFYDGTGQAELASANGITGIAGVMYTTWRDDYSQLENYARSARKQWTGYQAALPW